ncbi:MAG: hypothetical protein CM1200mP40_03560 [Gammaproteobacteria bacterium]|nr:MAG: hypothetical protein CM1200mP40_03560 [Gammaproteobacteria bacterium]
MGSGYRARYVGPYSWFRCWRWLWTSRRRWWRIRRWTTRGGGFGGGPPPGFFGRGGGGGGGRGFGGGSRETEILINGKRTAGKNNSTGGQLTRITSDQVDYIEIIRGTSGELDVRGSGQVVNVVLYDTFTDSTMQYQAQASQSDNNTISPSGTFSYSGQIEGLNFLVSASHSDNYFKSISKENSILGDFSPNDFIQEIRESDGKQFNSQY